MEANKSENIRIKTARTYLVYNREDEPLIQFRLILLPTSYVVIDTKILKDEGREILSLSKDANSQLEFNLALERYLETHQRDYKVSGYLLDEFIVDRLQLGQSVLSYGRLKGMEYLIDLLCYHFYDKENELYVTCKESGTISFFHSVPGWRRLIYDIPVSYKDIKETKQEEYDYVSVSQE